MSPLEVSTPAFREALLQVLTNQSFADKARGVMVKLHSHRKRTPAQEAAGER